MKKEVALVLFFLSVLSLSVTAQTQADNQKACEVAGATWREFPNGCGDSCTYVRNPGEVVCTQAVAYSCDCGPDQCWNGLLCENNDNKCPAPPVCPAGSTLLHGDPLPPPAIQCPSYSCTPTPTPFCGDGVCQSDEQTCLTACPTCPPGTLPGECPSECFTECKTTCPNDCSECTDSDRGKNIYTAGIAYMSIQDTVQVFPDKCLDTNKLTEYYCSLKEGRGYVVASEEINCALGCNNGACTSITTACTDSDRGRNIYEKGKTTGPEAGNPKNIVTREDSCSSKLPGGVTEYYCKDFGGTLSVVSESIDCPKGCEGGVCLTVACTAVYEPVCGVDGKTYSNSCYAGNAGVEVACKGECPCPPVACLAVYDPVCGADGKTYSNSCVAGNAGVKVACERECPCEKSDCGNGICETGEKDFCPEDCTPRKITEILVSREEKKPEFVKKQVFDSIKPETQALVNVQKEEIGIERIQINVRNEVKSVEIIVEKLEEKPLTLSAPNDKEVYQYLKIEKENLETRNIEQATIEFKVEKGWLKEKGLSEEEVVLLREVNRIWVELPTIKVREDALFVYYEALSDGFSYFAIAAKKEEIVLVAKEAPSIGESVEKLKKSAPDIIILAISAGLLFVLIYLIGLLFQLKERVEKK